jgi:hypothetical protein
MHGFRHLHLEIWVRSYRLYLKLLPELFSQKHSIERKTLYKLYDDMEAQNTMPLHYCEPRWLSRAKVLQRVFELKKEIVISLSDNNIDDANLFYNGNFIQKLACLVNVSGGEKLF